MPPSPAPCKRPPESLRTCSMQTSSSRPQVIDQVVQFIFSQIVGAAVLVLRIEDRPYLLERRSGPIVQVGPGDGNVYQLRRVQNARVVGRLLRPHIERLLIRPLVSAVAKGAAIRLRNSVAKFVHTARKQRPAALLRR